MVTTWERARRALATRLCMRFPARHAAVEDVPRGLDAVEEPFAAAEAKEDQQQPPQQQQQQGEREKSLGAASPAPASPSPRRASRSGSRSPAVISLSPLVAALCFCQLPMDGDHYFAQGLTLFLASIWVTWHGDRSCVETRQKFPET